MTPLSLLALQKFFALLTAEQALADQIAALAAALNLTVPPIGAAQVVLTAAPPALGDDNMQLSYPRVCLHCSGVKNTQIEKFRTFSGQIALTADIWASADLVGEADQWIHVYAASVAGVAAANVGDWGDGLYFGGVYDVQFQAPKIGGFGFVEAARLNFLVNASVS